MTETVPSHNTSSRRHLSQSQMTHGQTQPNHPNSQIQTSKHRSIITSNIESQSITSDGQAGQIWGTNIQSEVVQKTFRDFLMNFKEDMEHGQPIYLSRIQDL